MKGYASIFVVISPVAVWAKVFFVYVIEMVPLNLLPAEPKLAAGVNVISQAAPSSIWAAVALQVSPAAPASNTPIIAVPPSGVNVTATDVKSLPMPFLTIIFDSAPAPVTILKSSQLKPGVIVQLDGKNLDGFRTPKYANAPIAIRTTNMAQP